ncbi:chemotaxis protein CheD [Cerasibacillus terrae]|uniref:Probable chemoreceptor glutamine deamidase CheD n=1 Tax=Cerasibacillus terrae TaxID=2498845 RepID=A0A5C8P345_9BACI|nr:chemotaxis protein CheD [Cerasibacillus terrae]TXL67704.1 chemotaxis protein CheD [Cerasibacillus terrae]
MNKLGKVVKVGIADLNIAKAPNTIRTSGLGSCVGAVIFDKTKKIAGLAHIMLPDSKQVSRKEINEYKYADTAITILVEKLLHKGARMHALQAKIAGGAQMFQFANGNDMMKIGRRNIDATKKILAYYKIPIISSDVGGNSGRTIEFEPETSMLKIRTVNKGETFI